MPFRLRAGLCSLLFVAHFLCGASAFAADGEAPDERDSLMMALCYRARAGVNDPENLAVCDSLFARAERVKDRKMQATALCLHLDYFYFRNDRDGIVEGVKRVRDFCVKNGKKELRYYYYFAWGSRLITFHIKQNQYNIAIYETRRMLSEAQKEGYVRGVASCYRMLANLYLSQQEHALAYDYFRKEIDELERNGVDDINLPTQYASMAQCALEMEMPDSALVALRRAENLPYKSSYQQFTVNKAYALYYLAIKNFPAAKKRVDAAEALFDDPSMSAYRSGMYYLLAEYYKATGQYAKALETVQRSQRDTVLKKTDYSYYALSRDLGDIYYLMRDMQRSAESYREYIRTADSVHSREIRNAAEDFSGFLELGRLQNETREMQLVMQRRQLRNTYLIIFLLGGIVVIGGWAFGRLMKLNRRLKASEATVTAQNDHLLAAGEELRSAKERAEQVSRLKSDFIQNMSHEVRTPLNSIVGFSQVLASQFREMPAAAEYASIIEAGSMNLLRLIDDVLDISFLDQTPELPRPDCVQMGSFCRECTDKIMPEAKPGVAVIYERSADNPVVRTNARRLVQVLMHLLRNAVKFTVEGEIVLSYTSLPEKGLLRFTVTDTGPGIPSGKHEQVFERFVKLDAFSQGPGLGLPICRIIAEKLGGRLYVDPTYTRGCRMVFEVPFEKAAGEN